MKPRIWPHLNLDNRIMVERHTVKSCYRGEKLWHRDNDIQFEPGELYRIWLILHLFGTVRSLPQVSRYGDHIRIESLVLPIIKSSMFQCRTLWTNCSWRKIRLSKRPSQYDYILAQQRDQFPGSSVALVDLGEEIIFLDWEYWNASSFSSPTIADLSIPQHWYVT